MGVSSSLSVIFTDIPYLSTSILIIFMSAFSQARCSKLAFNWLLSRECIELG